MFGFSKQQPQVIMGSAAINALKAVCIYIDVHFNHVLKHKEQLFLRIIKTDVNRLSKIWLQMLYYYLKSLIICIMAVHFYKQLYTHS